MLISRIDSIASRASGPPAAADVDVVGVANAIVSGVLVKVIAKTFHGQSIVGIVFAPQLIGVV